MELRLPQGIQFFFVMQSCNHLLRLLIIATLQLQTGKLAD